MRIFITSIILLLLGISNLRSQEYYFHVSSDQTLTIEAIPNNGYNFIGWYDVRSQEFLSFSNTYTLDNIQSSFTIEAIFEVTDKFRIYPNPVRESLTIETFLPSSITIYNLHGGIMEYRDEKTYMHILNIGWIPAGPYLLRIQIDQEIYFSKIIVI